MKRKKALKKDLLRVLKKHQEWENIGCKEGEEVSETEIIEVLKELLKIYNKKINTKTMEKYEIYKKASKYAAKAWKLEENPNEYDNAREDFIAGAIWAIKNINKL